jgi:hypothetical protein
MGRIFLNIIITHIGFFLDTKNTGAFNNNEIGRHTNNLCKVVDNDVLKKYGYLWPSSSL